MAAKSKILLLCNNNASRGPMAAAFFNKYGSHRFDIICAGYDCTEIHPYTRQVMAEAGVELCDCIPVKIEEILGKVTARYLFILCDRKEKNCPITFLGAIEKISWPFEDPAVCPGCEDEKIHKFREVRDRINETVQQWLLEHSGSTAEAWEFVGR
jgi:arsenate reductase